MIEFIKLIDDEELNKEERNTLACAYNNMVLQSINQVGIKRAELRVLAEIEEKE